MQRAVVQPQLLCSSVVLEPSALGRRPHPGQDELRRSRQAPAARAAVPGGRPRGRSARLCSTARSPLRCSAGQPVAASGQAELEVPSHSLPCRSARSRSTGPLPTPPPRRVDVALAALAQGALQGLAARHGLGSTRSSGGHLPAQGSSSDPSLQGASLRARGPGGVRPGGPWRPLPVRDRTERTARDGRGRARTGRPPWRRRGRARPARLWPHRPRGPCRAVARDGARGRAKSRRHVARGCARLARLAHLPQTPQRAELGAPQAPFRAPRSCKPRAPRRRASRAALSARLFGRSRRSAAPAICSRCRRRACSRPVAGACSR